MEKAQQAGPWLRMLGYPNILIAATALTPDSNNE